MGELDMDVSGGLDTAEFMDRLKQFARGRHAASARCRALFDEADADGSGLLSPAEVGALARRMGLGAELAEHPDGFVAEMDGMELRGGGAGAAGLGCADGQINRAEFLAWFLEKGAARLARPVFESMALEVATAALLPAPARPAPQNRRTAGGGCSLSRTSPSRVQ
jgi:hypothetical protein